MSNQMKFKRSMFGLSKKEVVSYIDSISRSIEDKLFKKDTEISGLKKDIDVLKLEKQALQNEIDAFAEDKKKISDIFLKAEEAANNTVLKAQEEAEEIMKSTKEKIDAAYEKLEADSLAFHTEFEEEKNRLNDELTEYKQKINLLREKIKETLLSFDSALSDNGDSD